MKNLENVNTVNTTAAYTINDVIEEMIDSVITEAVTHFLHKKPVKKAQVEDDPRYFYSKSELDRFFSKFNQKRNENNPSHQLSVERMLDDNDCFLCFKVYR